MQKNHFLLTVFLLCFFAVSCGKNSCECTPGHDDYQGHCPCKSDDCQCPVRMHLSKISGEVVFDVWNKDPLTEGDTLFIKITSDLWRPTHVLYSYYYASIPETDTSPYLVKLVMPKGSYKVNVRLQSLAETSYTTTINLLSNVVVN